MGFERQISDERSTECATTAVHIWGKLGLYLFTFVRLA